MIEWLMSRRKQLPCWATRPVRTLDYFVNAFVFPDVSASCVCSKDKLILCIFDFRQYQGWLDWWRRSCKKGKKRVDAARNLKTSTGNPRGVRIWITFLSMTLRLWKSKWWLLRGGKVYELDARWKFWLVDNFERRESKISRNMAW